MYKAFRIIRIIIAVLALIVPTIAIILGYSIVFEHLQIMVALLSGAFIYLLFWGLVTWIYGRIYCSVFCPLGSFMDGVGVSARAIQKCSKRFTYHNPDKTTKYVFLSVAFLLVLVGGSFIPTLLDPYSAYARMIEEFIVQPLGLRTDVAGVSMASMAIAVVTFVGVVAVAWRRGRLICNTICPVGTMLSVVSRRSVFHIEIDPDRCIGCGECERVCKAECIDLTQRLVDTQRCVVCFNCTAACPNGAIIYRSGRFSLSTPLAQPTLKTDGASPSSMQNLKKHEAISRTP